MIQSKKDKFLKEESKVIQKIQRLNILKQIYSQIPLLYELNSDTKFITSVWKTTKEYIKMHSFMVIFWLLDVQVVVKPHFLKN